MELVQLLYSYYQANVVNLNKTSLDISETLRCTAYFDEVEDGITSSSNKNSKSPLDWRKNAKKYKHNGYKSWACIVMAFSISKKMMH